MNCGDKSRGSRVAKRPMRSASWAASTSSRMRRVCLLMSSMRLIWVTSLSICVSMLRALVLVFFGAQCAQDCCVAEEESAFVELLAAKPCRDLAVVFACIAGCAGGNHVLERVAAAARDWLNTIALHRHIRGLAVGTPAPSVTNLSPLRGREVVINSCQSTLPAFRVPRASYRRAGSGGELAARRHTFTVLRRRPWRDRCCRMARTIRKCSRDRPALARRPSQHHRR